MVSSITGQNEHWARLAAYQTPPAAQSSQTSGATSAYAPSALSAGSGDGAVTGDTSSPLADGTNFALLAFGSSAGAGGTAGAADGASIPATGTSAMSQLLTDLQSLLSTLGGTPSAAGGGRGAAGTPAANTGSSSVSNTGTTAGTLSQDLQQLSSDLGSLASTLETHRGEHGDHDRGAPPPGPPPGSSDILNTGTVSASSGSSITGSGTASASGGWATFMQQFAAGAYGSGYDGSTASSLLAINA